MSDERGELFGDARGRKRTRRIVVRCGSCREREGTITLAVSGLRRCRQCFEGMGLEERHARSVAPQPELEGVRSVPQSQPFASVRGMAARAAKVDFGSLVDEFKRRAVGDE